MITNNSKFGDLSNMNVSVAGKDMTEAVAELRIFGNIIDPFWSIEIDMIDTQNAIQNFKGKDKVKIKLETQQGFDTDGKMDIECIVYEIGRIVQNNQRAVTYTLICSQEDVINDSNKRVTDFFDGKKPHEIVKEIVQDYFDGSVGDEPPKPEQLKPHTEYKKTDGKRKKSEADNEVSWLAPNISPLAAIGRMCRIALYQNKADFVFFTKSMKSRPKYSFESLANMWKRKPCVKFVQRPNHMSVRGDFPFNKNLEFVTYHTDYYNNVVNIRHGYDANTVLTFDLFNKKWDSVTETRKGKNVIGEAESHIKFMAKCEKTYPDAEAENIFDKGKDWYKTRHSNLFTVEQNRIRLQFTGHVKGLSWLGEKCELDLPDNNSMAENELDSKYKGEYMITAFGALINRETFVLNVELANGWDK